jgi:hypothetical protein
MARRYLGVNLPGHVGEVMVKRPHSFIVDFSIFLSLTIVLRQTFVQHRPIESFHISGLLRVTWLNIFKPDSPIFLPTLYRRNDVLGLLKHKPFTRLDP